MLSALRIGALLGLIEAVAFLTLQAPIGPVLVRGLIVGAVAALAIVLATRLGIRVNGVKVTRISTAYTLAMGGAILFLIFLFQVLAPRPRSYLDIAVLGAASACFAGLVVVLLFNVLKLPFRLVADGKGASITWISPAIAVYLGLYEALFMVWQEAVSPLTGNVPAGFALWFVGGLVAGTAAVSAMGKTWKHPLIRKA